MKLKRRKKQLSNPFLQPSEWGEEVNLLWELDYIDRNIEDIIVGCVRSMNAHLDVKQEAVNWYKVYKLYRNVDELTVESIKSYMRCSDRQVTRYVQAITLCTQHIKRYYRINLNEQL